MNTIRFDVDKPRCVELVDPYTGELVDRLHLSSFHACRLAAADHGRKYADPDRHCFLWSLLDEEHGKLELQESTPQGRIVGVLARFRPVDTVPAQKNEPTSQSSNP